MKNYAITNRLSDKHELWKCREEDVYDLKFHQTKKWAGGGEGPVGEGGGSVSTISDDFVRVSWSNSHKKL